jgi:hypothetical protein
MLILLIASIITIIALCLYIIILQDTIEEQEETIEWYEDK